MSMEINVDFWSENSKAYDMSINTREWLGKTYLFYGY